MAFSLAIISMLKENDPKYLSRDILFLAYDGNHKQYGAST